MATITYTLLKLVPLLAVIWILKKLFELYKKKKELKRALKDFPGPAPHWLWGNMKQVCITLFYTKETTTYNILTRQKKNISFLGGGWDFYAIIFSHSYRRHILFICIDSP